MIRMIVLAFTALAGMGWGEPDPKKDFVTWAFQHYHTILQKYPSVEDQRDYLYSVYNDKIEKDSPAKAPDAGSIDWWGYEDKESLSQRYILADGKTLENQDLRRIYQTPWGPKSTLPEGLDASLFPIIFYNARHDPDAEFRHYLNVKAGEAERVYADAVQTFLDRPTESMQFYSQIKMFERHGLHRRVDGIVMYGVSMSESQRNAFKPLMDAFLERHSDKLMQEIPGTTIKIRPGFSFAPEPKGTFTGRGYGDSIVSAIVDTLADRKASGSWVSEGREISSLNNFEVAVRAKLNRYLGSGSCYLGP